MLKSDKWIKEHSQLGGLIDPAVNSIKCKGVLSYGVSSYGYDVRLGNTFKMFNCSKTNNAIVDPKNVPQGVFRTVKSDSSLLIPPRGTVLGHSIETVDVPKNVTGLVFPKSTYVRCGLEVIQTVLEAGWKGQITLCLVNHTDFPLKVYVGEGIAQVLFVEGAEECETSYADRDGKYQGEKGISLARIK